MQPKVRATAIAFLSALGALLFGLDIGYIAPILECASFKRDVAHLQDWDKPFSRIPDVTAGFIVGIFSIGCIVSTLPPVSAYFLDVWGRRMSIILGSAIFLAGSGLQCLATSINMMLAGRLVSGLSIGLLSSVVALYQTELAPTDMRGCLTSVYQLMICLGILLAVLLDQVLVNRDGGWRWAIAIQMVPAFVLLFAMPSLPRSPRWLVQQGLEEEALESLRSVREEEEAQKELAEIVESHKKSQELPELTWAELLTGRPRQLFTIGITLQLLQQFVGMNAFMYFGPRIFADLGFNPYRLQTATQLVNFLSAIPALFLADICGRRSLLLWSGIGMTFASVGLGSLGCAFMIRESDGYQSTNQQASYAMVAMVFGFVASFEFGWGPVVWVYNSEIFPLRCRSRFVAASACANWVGNYIIAQSTPMLLGKHGFASFYIYAVFCFAAVLMALWLPETKGVLLEHMDKIFDAKFGVKGDLLSKDGKSKYGATGSSAKKTEG